jgi:hypothetical protein
MARGRLKLYTAITNGFEVFKWGQRGMHHYSYFCRAMECLDYEMCQNYTKESTKFDTQRLVPGRPEITLRGDARIHQPHLKSNGRIVESRQNCMLQIYLNTRLMSSVQLVLAFQRWSDGSPFRSSMSSSFWYWCVFHCGLRLLARLHVTQIYPDLFLPKINSRGFGMN